MGKVFLIEELDKIKELKGYSLDENGGLFSFDKNEKIVYLPRVSSMFYPVNNKTSSFASKLAYIANVGTKIHYHMYIYIINLFKIDMDPIEFIDIDLSLNEEDKIVLKFFKDAILLYKKQGYKIVYFKDKPLIEQKLIYISEIHNKLKFSGTFDLVLINEDNKNILHLDYKVSVKTFDKSHDHPCRGYLLMLKNMFQSYKIESKYLYANILKRPYWIDTEINENSILDKMKHYFSEGNIYDSNWVIKDNIENIKF